MARGGASADRASWSSTGQSTWQLRSAILSCLLAVGCAARPSERTLTTAPGWSSARIEGATGDAKQATGGATVAPPPSFAPCPATVPAGMVCIPGGTFVRGDAEEEHAGPAESVSVSTFFLDVHEVTNAEWNACREAGECRRLTRFRGYLGDAQPAVAMRWDEAVAFCARRGARLPTEAEWERAASGPEDTRYPWGDAPGSGCDNAIVRIRAGRGCGTDVTAAVMSRPAFGFGLFDMAGNVYEWVEDSYSPCYRGCEHECGDACSGLDPRGPCGGPAGCETPHLRVVRGGAWWWDIDRATVTARRGVPADNPNPHRFGFRCAADPTP